METMEIDVDGMTCGGCENAVQNVIGALERVESVKADHETGKVTISLSGPVDLDRVRTVVSDAGYSVIG